MTVRQHCGNAASGYLPLLVYAGARSDPWLIGLASEQATRDTTCRESRVWTVTLHRRDDDPSSLSKPLASFRRTQNRRNLGPSPWVPVLPRSCAHCSLPPAEASAAPLRPSEDSRLRPSEGAYIRPSESPTPIVRFRSFNMLWLDKREV
jgi:hypothetical protein